MRMPLIGCAVCVVSVLSLAGGTAQAGSSVGPDVIVSGIANGNDYTYYGSSGSIHAYAFATTSCNIGNQEVLWFDAGVNNDQHPVISQNMFRLKDGRLEQIGVSWLKHGFCAVNEFSCGSCQQTSCDTLGLDCADTYSSSLNGSATWRGARSEVNPTTGAFPYPPVLAASGNSTIRGRLQVQDADINPTFNAGAQYFMEVNYLAKDDLAAGNGLNSASWRDINVNSVSSITFPSATHMMEPAIFAWAANDPAVKVSSNAATNDGAFYLAYKFTDLGGGMWRYEYGVYNFNSDRAGQAFTVPVGPGVSISNIGFHDIDHHSGEPYATTDWTTSTPGCNITWQTDDFATDVNANALRWGTMFNFWFDADSPPQVATVDVTLFKPGTPGSIGFSAFAPAGVCAMGDSDCDGDSDLIDFARMQECLPLGALPAGDPCRIFDADCNASIDLGDYAAFEAVLGGP